MDISERTALLKKALKKAQEADKLLAKARSYDSELHDKMADAIQNSSAEEWIERRKLFDASQEDFKAHTLMLNIREINDGDNHIACAINNMTLAIKRVAEEAAKSASQ